MKTRPTHNKIIIIGAGISGLAAGIYAKKAGFDVDIYEKNPSVGGLCTSWDRKGYTIDGCIHWLTGTKENTDLYKMWMDVGAFKSNDDIIQSDIFATLNYNGETIRLWNDSDKLKEEMLKISPEDKKHINKFIKVFKKIEKVDFPLHMPTDTMNIFELTAVLPMLMPIASPFMYAATKSTRTYAKRFKSPILRYAISNIVPGRNNLFANMFSYATVSSGNGGVPKGGSKPMVERMLKTYLDLGGRIHLAKEVQGVIIEKRIVKGIVLKNNEKVYGDYIVSSTDVLYTLKHLLKHKYHSFRFFKRRDKIHRYPIPSCVYVTYSVDVKKYQALNLGETYQFNTEPFLVGYTIQDSIRLRDYSYDEYFIRNGRVTVNVLISQSDINYPFWKLLAKDRKAYLKEKERVAEVLKERIEAHLPSLKGDLEILDVVTPVTYHRYCNSSYGGYMSFSWTDENNMLMHNGKIRGIKNFYIAGQWLQMPGGLPLALSSGKFAVQRIMKKEKMNYRITPKKKEVKHDK